MKTRTSSSDAEDSQSQQQQQQQHQRLLLDEILAFVDDLGAPSPVPFSSSPSAAMTTGTWSPTPPPSSPMAPDGRFERRQELLMMTDENGGAVVDHGRDGDAPGIVVVDAQRHHPAPRPSSPALSASSSSSSPPSSVIVPLRALVPMMLAPVPPKRRRRRQKEELKYLRGHVRELEDELRRLRSETLTARVKRSCTRLQHHDEIASDANSAQISTTVPIVPQRAGEWEERARNEKAAVQRALIENIHLRAVLESQLSIARAFETALQQRQLSTEEVAPYVGDAESSAYVDHKTENQIYESLGRNLDALYAQVDAVVMPWRPRTRKPTGEVSTATDIRADTRGMYLEHREHRVVPFSTPAVCKTMWDTLCGGKYDLESGICITMGHTEDTVSLKIIDSFCLSKSSREETVMTMRFVIKRFLEENRAVFVWESLVETVGHVCIRQREQVWTVFRPEPDELEERCEALACIRVRPEMVASDSDEGTDIGLLTNLVVSSYKRNFGSMAKIVYDHLLTDRAIE